MALKCGGRYCRQGETNLFTTRQEHKNSYPAIRDSCSGGMLGVTPSLELRKNDFEALNELYLKKSSSTVKPK
ncbi:hypothetical protein MTHERMOG20_11050 [Moorella thermoacetica]|nr:hypothetical protein MTHERMOG20_11050 [Moorella thermoacetica]